jgi:hypothetical protein
MLSAPSQSPPPLPGWVRLVDGVCVLLAGLAIVIAVSGGFRERLFGVRVALTSPYRLMLWAVVLGVVRHALVRRRPIYADLSARLVAQWRTPETRAAVGAFVGTRPAVLLVGYLAVSLIGFPSGAPPWRAADNEFLNLPARWDVGWYLGIAIDGYSFSDVAGDAVSQQNIVFFPALPLLMRVAGRLLGGEPAAFVWAATCCSLLAFLGALVYVYRLARDLLGDDARAALSVWLLAAYPFALFYGAPYTESLFLLGSAGAIYHFRRGGIWKGGAWGFLVGLTRPNGCFLSVALALLAIEPWLPHSIAGGPPARSGPRTAGQLARSIAAASLPGVAMLLYSAFIWSLTGNPLSWAEGHVAWGRSYQGLSILITQRYQFLSEAGLYAYTSQGANDLLQLLGVLFVLASVWPVARRFGLAHAVFIAINILPPLAAGGLLSAGRFSSVLFPAFIWLASVVAERHRSGWLSGFMALQALNAVLFFTWRHMY